MQRSFGPKYSAAFFAARPLVVNDRKQINLPVDMLKYCAGFLTAVDLNRFRQVCVQTYNAVEMDLTLLLKQRFYRLQCEMDIVIGSCIRKAADGKITILTAFQLQTDPNHFWVRKSQLTTLSELMDNTTYRFVRITHVAKYNVVPENHDGDNIWSRAVSCTLDAKGHISVAAEFTEHQVIRHPQGGHIDRLTGNAHHYDVELDMVDFEIENKIIPAVRRS